MKKQNLLVNKELKIVLDLLKLTGHLPRRMVDFSTESLPYLSTGILGDRDGFYCKQGMHTCFPYGSALSRKAMRLSYRSDFYLSCEGKSRFAGTEAPRDNTNIPELFGPNLEKSISKSQEHKFISMHIYKAALALKYHRIIINAFIRTSTWK